MRCKRCHQGTSKQVYFKVAIVDNIGKTLLSK